MKVTCSFECYLDDVDVMTPPFAESITQGDIRWEKGKSSFFLFNFIDSILFFLY